jgi:hypothetical protein
MSEQEKIFADGFSFKRQESAPDFVVGSLSMKVDEAIEFMKTNSKKGWLNLQIKQARSGNYYIELDTWEPKQQGGQRQAPAPAAVPNQAQAQEDELPF